MAPSIPSLVLSKDLFIPEEVFEAVLSVSFITFLYSELSAPIMAFIVPSAAIIYLPSQVVKTKHVAVPQSLFLLSPYFELAQEVRIN